MIVSIIDVEACARTNLPLDRAIARAEDLGVEIVLVRTRIADRQVTKTVAAVPRSGTTRRIVNAPWSVYDPTVFDGVHLKAGALPGQPPPPILGASVHDGDPMTGLGADYLLFAPVFAPRSKIGVEAVGLDALVRAVRHADCAVIALGGIGPEHVEAVAATGCAGLAALTPFCSPDDSMAHDLVARVRDVRWTPAPEPERLRLLLGIA